MTQSYCSHVPTAAARPRLVLPCTPEDWSSGQIVNPGCEDVFFCYCATHPRHSFFPHPSSLPGDGGRGMVARFCMHRRTPQASPSLGSGRAPVLVLQLVVAGTRGPQFHPPAMILTLLHTPHVAFR